ncbi:MAG: EamA/RhaT family transporter, partial [Rhodospirillaceae bacterium]|nr:EamA/RhaT family transporter [Rhodospirillaceae bacterium]
TPRGALSASSGWRAKQFSIISAGLWLCALLLLAAPPQVLAPFDYTAMIWAILLGFFIWGDLPSWTVVGGATILIASGLYVWWREAQQEKLAR